MDDVAAEQMREAIDAVRIRAADVEDLPGNGRSRRRHERIHDVGDEGEVAGLGPVADDGQRLPVEFLGEKHAKDRTVGAGRPRARTVDVEQAERDDRQPVDLRPVERVLLAGVLGQGVRILRADRG